MSKILIIGGTGMLGRPVTNQLIDDGFDIRLFTTNVVRAELLFGDKVEYAAGNVDDPQSLIEAMEGCEQVYINLKGGPTNEDIVRVEYLGSKNIYKAATQTEIRKVVQISGALADEKHSFFILERTKLEAEKELKASGLTYTILKPTWFCESLPLFLNQKRNRAICIGSGRTSFHFLAASDYAQIVSKCLQSDLCDNKILTIFGPEPMPIPEAMRRFLAIVHPTTNIDRLPIWLAKLSAICSFNKKTKMAVKFMAFFDKHGDDEVVTGPEEADHLLGRCQTTVEEWSTKYRKSLKGV